MADKFPKATLGQYKGLAVTRHVRPVLDSTVEAEICLLYKTDAADD